MSFWDGQGCHQGEDLHMERGLEPSYGKKPGLWHKSARTEQVLSKGCLFLLLRDSTTKQEKKYFIQE